MAPPSADEATAEEFIGDVGLAAGRPARLPQCQAQGLAPQPSAASATRSASRGKLSAPIFVASTAVSMGAWPDIMITGIVSLPLRSPFLEQRHAVGIGHPDVEQHQVRRLTQTDIRAPAARFSPLPPRHAPRRSGSPRAIPGCPFHLLPPGWLPFTLPLSALLLLSFRGSRPHAPPAACRPAPRHRPATGKGTISISARLRSRPGAFQTIANIDARAMLVHDFLHRCKTQAVPFAFVVT